MAICSCVRRATVVALLAFTMAGCYHQPVQHLCSDVCLLLPGKTTQQQVIAYLGTPDQRRLVPGKGETWIYYQVNKSFLRKMPLVGKKMGEEHYDVVTVTFQGNVVRTCAYRSYNEHEFNQAGLATSEPSHS